MQCGKGSICHQVSVEDPDLRLLVAARSRLQESERAAILTLAAPHLDANDFIDSMSAMEPSRNPPTKQGLGIELQQVDQTGETRVCLLEPQRVSVSATSARHRARQYRAADHKASTAGAAHPAYEPSFIHAIQRSMTASPLVKDTSQCHESLTTSVGMYEANRELRAFRSREQS